jgi:hypothetical protein
VETQNNTGRPDGSTGRPDGSRATSLPEIFGAARSKESGRAANGQRTGLRTGPSGFSTGGLLLHHVRTGELAVRTVLVPMHPVIP